MDDIERIIGRMNRDSLALDENETTFTQTGDDRGVWLNPLLRRWAWSVRVARSSQATAISRPLTGRM